MTLTLVATAGAADSNCYCTLEEAEAYVATMTFATDWTGKSDEQKKAAIIQAARWIDTLQFKGDRSSQAQAMAWPRCEQSAAPRFAGLTVTPTGYLKDEDGYDIAADTVPVRVKNANAEMALRQLGSDWTQGLGSVTTDSQKVGPIEQGRKTYRSTPAAVLALLRPFLAVMPGTGGKLLRG